MLDGIPTVTSFVTREQWRAWFCDVGIAAFQTAVSQATDRTIAYAREKHHTTQTNSSLRPNPIFRKHNIIDIYKAGFVALLAEFKKKLPDNLTASDNLSIDTLNERFKEAAIYNHQKFYALEAEAKTKTKCQSAMHFSEWHLQSYIFQQCRRELKNNVEDNERDDNDENYFADDEGESDNDSTNSSLDYRLLKDITSYVNYMTEYFNITRNSMTLSTHRLNTFAPAAPRTTYTEPPSDVSKIGLR